MPDALEVSDLKVSFKKGDRVVRRDRPLLPPLIVHHVRRHFAGEPEVNGPVFCTEEGALLGVLPRAWNQSNLAHCPPGYEPAPPSGEPWRTLFWAQRNWERLVSLHGDITMAQTVRRVRERIRMHEQIETALAAEPQADAMRRAEIALAEAGR